MHGFSEAGPTDFSEARSTFPEARSAGIPQAGQAGIPQAGQAGIPQAGSTAAAPPDWPAPGTPLPGEEPTIELPVVTEAMLAASPPAASPTSARSSWARRVPALERRGPRPAAPARAVALDDLLDQPRDRAGVDDRTHPDDPARLDDFPRMGDPARPGDLPLTDDPARPGDFQRAGDPARPGDFQREDGQGEGATSGDGPGEPGRRWMVGAGIAAAALLLTGATVVVLDRDRGPTAGWGPPVAAPAAPARDHTVTAALAGRTVGGFDLVDGAETVTVRAADLGDILYRITTPEAGAAVPRTDEQDGRVRLRFDGDAQSVDITLHAAVRWDLRVAGGAELSTIDLSAGRVGGVDLAGGASRITLTLPRPDGTLGVRMSGGVSLFDVRTADRTPVRVRVGRGAGQVTLNGQNHAGVAAGQTFTPAAWAAAVDRVDVDAAAGLSALTVAPY